MLSPPNFILLSAQDKDALIVQLLARLEALERENAALREKLNLPPKTPDNSSTPPAAGHKSNGETMHRPKGKPHAGAHRPLHPNPSRCRAVPASQCQHCGANVSGVVQTPVHSYDRIEIPEIKPDVTRVTLLGGLCPCCAKPFKAAPPAGLEPGSPFGPNLRAFAIYLRFTQAISFERLSQLFSDLLGLEISEGALVNMLDDSKLAFARAASLIRARLLAGTILLRTRPVCASANGLGGPGYSITPRTPASSSIPTAAGPWSNNSWANTVPISGFPTGSRPR